MSIPAVHAHWKSTTWGAREWGILFQVRPDVYEALLDAMGRIGHRHDLRRAKQIWAEICARRGIETPQSVQPRRKRALELPEPSLPAAAELPRARRKVLGQLALGRNRAEAAAALNLSPDTVKIHLKVLMREFECARAAALVPVALRELGVVPPEQWKPALGPAVHEVVIGTAWGYSRKEIAELTRRTDRTVGAQLNEVHRRYGVSHSVAMVHAGFACRDLDFEDERVVGIRDGEPWLGRLALVS